MKAATLNELKRELQTLTPARVIELCMHLAKYKKENKEMLTYLLFEAQDEPAYIKDVKDQIDEQFEGMNKSNLYLTKKCCEKFLELPINTSNTQVLSKQKLNCLSFSVKNLKIHVFQCTQVLHLAIFTRGKFRK